MNSKDAISLLKKYSTDKTSFETVLAHSKAVKEVALELWEKANQHGHSINRELIISGSLLHDIGRFAFPPGEESIKHGIKGAEILRRETLIKESRIAERHVGFGIRAFDIEVQHLPLPKKDYMPETKEEKIVCYADKLIAGSERISFEATLKRFTQDIAIWMLKRGISLHNEVMELCSPKEKIKIKEIEDILRYLRTESLIELFNNSELSKVIKGLGINSCKIEIERDQPYYIYAEFSQEGDMTLLRFIKEDEGIKAELNLKIQEAKVIEIYEKSEDYAESPKRMIEILDAINIPEEQKGRLVISLLRMQNH